MIIGTGRARYPGAHRHFPGCDSKWGSPRQSLGIPAFETRKKVECDDADCRQPRVLVAHQHHQSERFDLEAVGGVGARPGTGQLA